MTNKAESRGSRKSVPIERYILAALCRQVERTFGVAEKSVMINTRAMIHDNFTQAEQFKKITKKFLYLQLQSAGDNEDGTRVNTHDYSSSNALKAIMQNQQGGVKAVTALSVIPTTFTFKLGALIAGFTDMMDFVNACRYASETNSMDFKLKYKDFEFSIQVDVDRSIEVPEREKLGESSGFFELESTLKVSGFVSDAAYDKYAESGVLREIELELFVDNELTVESDTFPSSE